MLMVKLRGHVTRLLTLTLVVGGCFAGVDDVISEPVRDANSK